MENNILTTPIEFLKGVGPSRAELLRKELGIHTYFDLLEHFPFRYIDRTQFHKIRALNPEQPYVQVIARLISVQEVGEKRSRRLVAKFKDDTGVLEAVWFQGIAWVKKMLVEGEVYVLFGKPQLFNSSLNLSHPELEKYIPGKSVQGNSRLQPLYSSTEKLKKLSLDSKGLQKLILTLMSLPQLQIVDDLPEYILTKHQLAPLNWALKNIHFPTQASDLDHAKRRLKFNELFFVQLKLLRDKTLSNIRFKGHVFDRVGENFNTFYNEHLPFDLTNAQKRVIKEIRKDASTGAQMNRLVQGDVGSGKTVVALMAMLLASDNDFQACLMAPTEILAQQHFKSITKMLKNDLVQVRILTGSTPKKERKVLQEELMNGLVDILIGTHALIEDPVQYKNLGLVIIDEQHRFGVEQRAKLWRKNTIPPHMLVMTATPIPRTLAMTLYGDLDISVIDELPKGRKPIQTMHFFENNRLRLFGFMRQEIAKGRQVYVVYPLIQESEKLDLLNLEAGLEGLLRDFPRPQYQISIVHGKMPVKDKDFEMQRFIKGETQIMVATTVIEVGVDVPNATVMVIENAERFGLSQLHQLRGRVGRGSEQSYCILMSSNKLSNEGKLRLETMVKTQNGFEIAEVDLQLRGPGDMAGTQQSGVLDFKIADLTQDQALLAEARATVQGVFQNDPLLSKEENVKLLQYLNKGKFDGIGWENIS